MIKIFLNSCLHDIGSPWMPACRDIIYQISASRHILNLQQTYPDQFFKYFTT